MSENINAIYKLGIATWLSKSMQESKFYKNILIYRFIMKR